MPSPIAHLGTGYAIYLLSTQAMPEQLKKRYLVPLPLGLVLATGFSIAPDVDSAVGLLTGQFAKFHNNLTHSLFVALGVGLVAGALLRWRLNLRFRPAFLITFSSYALHVIMDSAAVSRGVMAFWPLSSDRFLFPITIFYGLHWSDGIFSAKHIITIVTEAAFVAALVVASRLVLRRRQNSGV